MPLPTILLVGSDHAYTAALRLTLSTRSQMRVVGDVHSSDAAVLAARLHPDALLLRARLPGRLLVPLVRDLRAASPANTMVVIAARAVLDGATVRALFERGVRGCLAEEDVPPAAVVSPGGEVVLGRF